MNNNDKMNKYKLKQYAVININVNATVNFTIKSNNHYFHNNYFSNKYASNDELNREQPFYPPFFITTSSSVSFDWSSFDGIHRS